MLSTDRSPTTHQQEVCRPMEAMMELKAVSRIYNPGAGEVRALDDVDLVIAEGEMLAVMGPSGSGKSTLMNILGCLDRPTGGIYRLHGQDVQDMTDDEQARVRNQHLGFIFQQFNLLPQLDAEQNVELPLIYRRVSVPERRRRAREVLGLVGLGDRTSHKPNELSGGQQQRVAVARALVGDPVVLLADEPTGNLDTRSGTQLMGLFQELNSRGRTVIVVTHDPEVAQYCERVVRLRDGRVVSDERVPHPASADERLLEMGEEGDEE